MTSPCAYRYRNTHPVLLLNGQQGRRTHTVRLRRPSGRFVLTEKTQPTDCTTFAGLVTHVAQQQHRMPPNALCLFRGPLLLRSTRPMGQSNQCTCRYLQRGYEMQALRRLTSERVWGSLPYPFPDSSPEDHSDAPSSPARKGSCSPLAFGSVSQLTSSSKSAKDEVRA